MPAKVTVNLPDETVAAIQQIAKRRNTNVTEALKQVIESQRFLDEEVDNGSKVLIKSPDQSYRELLFNIPKRSRNA